MRQDNWNLEPDQWDYPGESETEEYAEEYSLEEILAEFSGSANLYAAEPREAYDEVFQTNTEPENEYHEYEKYEEYQRNGRDGDGGLSETDFTEVSEKAEKLPENYDFGLDFLTDWDAERSAAAGTAYRRDSDADAGNTSIPDNVLTSSEPEPALQEQTKREKRNAEAKSRRIQKRKRQNVLEEFPETPYEESPAAQSDIDYSALFRMFADPRPENVGSAAEQPEGTARRSASDTGDNAADAQKTASASKQKPKEEPLLAENPGDFRDILREFMMGDQHPIYADMPGIGKKAGEETPYTADDLSDLDAVLDSMVRKNASTDIPSKRTASERVSSGDTEAKTKKAAAPEPASGLKKKFSLNLKLKKRQKTEPEIEAEDRAETDGESGAGAEKAPETESGPSAESMPESETEQKQTKLPKRNYYVEEDFPTEPAANEREGNNEREFVHVSSAPEKQTAEDNAKPERTAAEEKSDDPVSPEPDQTESGEDLTQEGRLRKLLNGLGSGAGKSRKRARNEPRAYASYEDYIPQAEPGAAASADGTTGERGAAGTDRAAETDQTSMEDLPVGEEEDDEILYAGDFPPFGQWILNELMTFWIRLNGIGDRQSTATMEDDREDLGKEVNVANASRYYGSQVTMLRMRFQIGLVLIAILAYLTLGFPVSGMLKTARVSAAMCLGLQLTIMLLCLDVLTNAAVNLTRGRFGADALAVLACVISSLDALNVAVGGFGNPHIPLCLFSSLALMGILFSALLSARALRKSTRVPAIGKRVYCVTTEEGVRSSGDLTLLKSIRPSAGFVRRAEETPPDESLYARFAVIELLAALLLSLLTGIVKHSMADYLYILSAILSCAVPVTALLAFALPFFIGSGRIFSSGAAVAGWSGIHDIGCSRNLIVTDRDLFPEDTVSIETVRIFADDSAERVIGFAGSMIAASGSGLAPSFAELMEKNNCRMRNVEDFQWLAGGGLQGHIEGHTVLCGSSDLMQLMNVKVPYRLVDRTTVLLAIDGVLYGIFKINYIGLPEIRTALQELIASNRHPIFAIRDFNITPDLLHEVFDVATDGYDFPPYGDRFRISEAKPSETSKISAVICREGLGPLTHLADTGRSMYVAIRMNLIITAVVTVLGMMAVFFRLIGAGELNAWLPFILMLLDMLLVTLISLFMRF